jgi:hypothetical protein
MSANIEVRHLRLIDDRRDLLLRELVRCNAVVRRGRATIDHDLDVDLISRRAAHLGHAVAASA